MTSLVCCMIELQLLRGFEDEAFPNPLDVQTGVVGIERQVKVHQSLSCLFFLMQEFFPTGWALLVILLCADNGFREQSCHFIQVVAAVENSSRE